jgi:thermitase
MKRIGILLSVLFIVVVSPLVLWTKDRVSAAGQNDSVKGQVLVRFKEGVTPAEADNVHRQIGGKVKATIAGIGVQVVDVGSKNVGEAVSAYARDGRVDFAEPDFIAAALVDDSFFDNQWGLNNTGQTTCNTAGDICTSGSPDADVDALEAWSITTGSPEVKIAILDSGIDQNHPDLMGKIALNNNFSGSDTVDDLYGHGTHVAGIAAAQTNNSLGVAGVGYQSQLMNGKVLGDDGYGAYSWIAAGIVWAADNGADVINLSLGGNFRSATLESAVNYAWGKGALIVAAAGNAANPSKTYPAYYQNCISVAATDNTDAKASFSSYGSWVDVAAPGENIYSTFPNHAFYLQTEYGRSNNYDFGSGTSMSTPHVAGITALVWAAEPGLSNEEVRDRIEQTADAIPGTGRYWIWGRVNACNAVGGNCSVVVPPPTPTPTSEPSPEPSPTPQPDACSAYCFKGVCDGQCHPVKDLPGCPDCLASEESIGLVDLASSCFSD